MTKVLDWFWNRAALATAVPDRSLSAFRWILGCYLLLFDAPYFRWVDESPQALFDPPLFSLSQLVGGFPPAPFFTVLDIVAIIAICTMTTGYRVRTSTIIVLVTNILATTFAYSHGKISHQIALSAILFCMILANWGKNDEDGVVKRRRLPDVLRTSRRSLRGVALMGVLLAFGFFTAGFGKVMNWVNADVSRSGFLGWYYPRVYNYDLILLADAVPGVPPILLKVGDVAGSLLEVLGLVALLCGAYVWRSWLIAITGLHLFNALVLNITFTTQTAIYLVFVNLLWLARPGLERYRKPAVAAVVVLAAWHIWMRLQGGGSGFFLVNDPVVGWHYDIFLSIAACFVVGILLAWDLLARWRTRQDAAADPQTIVNA